MTRVVIAGVSTRAAAASAARAGFVVTAIDAYADRDQHPGVRAIALPRDVGSFTAAAAATAAAIVEADAAAYLSNFENDANAVATLSAGRALWGNPPDVLRRARDPFLVAALFRAHGLAVPEVTNDPNVPNDPNDPNESWLLKPLSSGGGHGIRPWRGGRVPAGCYRQQRIDGTPGSIVFVAAAGQAVPLGISRQLIGDSRFGAGGYRYCGNIFASPEDAQFADGQALGSAAGRLTGIAAAGFGLAGVNGIDFVALAGVPYPTEINPRWSASMELVERAFGVNVFAMHAAACTGHQLPAATAAPLQAFGKAIVFAREAVVIGNTDGWLADADIRDVPHAGESIGAGSPVCTVFARGPDAAACYDRLTLCAERIYDELDRWRHQAANVTSTSPFIAHD